MSKGSRWGMSNMEIVVDVDGIEPLFGQLVQQIKEAVKAGKIKGGDPLPSIRQLANDLEVNHKTVAKAYRLLERDAVILTRGYRGTFVHPEASLNCETNIAQTVHDELTEVICDLRDKGATDSEIRIAFGEIMKKRSI